MTRLIALIGWVCLALDAAFVIALIVIRDAGDDAAGRGVGRGWGLVLLPVLLLAAALLYWGTKSGSKMSSVIGTARTELTRVEAYYAETNRPMEPGYVAFVAALAKHDSVRRKSVRP